MKTIVLEKNPDGNVVLSVDQIRKMLDDAYDEGYRDGKAADKVQHNDGDRQSVVG